MINVTELAEVIISEAGVSLEIEEIAKEIKSQNKLYKNMDNAELLGLIHTDLSIDGRFIYNEKKWDLKRRYSILDLENIKSKYVSNEIDKEIDELEMIEKEIDNDENLDSIANATSGEDDVEENITEIDELTIVDEEKLK